MKYIVISDLHSNFCVLKELSSLLNKYKTDVIVVFLGDLIGYYKFNPCLINYFKHIRDEYKVYCLLGNHDAAFCNKYLNTKYNVNDLINININLRVNPKDVDELALFYNSFIKDCLELTIAGTKHIFSHGGIDDFFNSYFYPDMKFLERSNHLFEKNVAYVCGHTHHTFIYRGYDHTIINTGSIGMPRDRNVFGSYLEIEDNNYEIKRCSFNLDELYSYNIDLPNSVKNRVYFGGNSLYISNDLKEFSDYETDEIKNCCKNETLCFKRVIICNDKKVLKTDNKYLFVDNCSETIYNRLQDLIERFSHG